MQIAQKLSSSYVGNQWEKMTLWHCYLKDETFSGTPITFTKFIILSRLSEAKSQIHELIEKALCFKNLDYD